MNELGLPRCDIAGIDVGASKTTIIVNSSDQTAPQVTTIPTSGHATMAELLRTTFSSVGFLPRHAVIAAGGFVNPVGEIDMTNQDWPLFDSVQFASTHGMSMAAVNDMHGQLAGIRTLSGSDLTCLTSKVPKPNTKSCAVVALGSGVGVAFSSPDGAIHATASGHSSWQPASELERELLIDMQTALKPTVTIEDVIGGLRGWDSLYQFMSKRSAPQECIAQQIKETQKRNSGLGSIFFRGAEEHDHFSIEILNLYGSILGQFLRIIALAFLFEESGTIYLSGGVVHANNIQYLVNETPLRERFECKESPGYDLLQTVPFFAIHDEHVAAKGAYALAMKKAANDETRD